MNEKILDELENNVIKLYIDDMIHRKKFKSIKNVKVFVKKVKTKWFFISFKKEIRVIKFTVDESLVVIESMFNDLSFEELANLKSKEHKIEIEYI